MKHTTRAICGAIVAVAALTSLVPVARAQSRTQVTLSDSGVSPENLTSSQDGTVYFGSMTKGTIYRAAPVPRRRFRGFSRRPPA